MSESARAQAVAWVPPAVSGPIANQRTRHRREDLDAIGRDAWDAGFARGMEAGRVAAHAEVRARLAEIDAAVAGLVQVADALARPLAALDEAVERELASLACSIARHVVRRELRTDPSQVIAAVREAVGLLPIAARDVRVHLHPEDAALVRERLAEPREEHAWTIVEDPVLARGGCRVSTTDSQVDARLESRIGAVIAAVLGDDRTPSAGGTGGAV